VARSSHGVDQPIVAERGQDLAKAPDVDIHRAILHVDGHPPDPVQDLVATEGPIRVSHEELPEPVLRRSHGDLSALSTHPETGGVQDEATDLDALVLSRRRPTTRHRI